MSLATIHSKKSGTAKTKTLGILKTGISNLRNCISVKKNSGPDVFDMTRNQPEPKAGGKASAKR